MNRIEKPSDSQSSFRSSHILSASVGSSTESPDSFHRLPVSIYYSPSSFIPLCIINIRIRLAPEHPSSALLDDCLLAYQWALKHLSYLGLSNDRPLRLALAGDSAGGSMALSLALRLIHEGHRIPDGISLGISPISPYTFHSLQESIKGIVVTYPAVEVGGRTRFPSRQRYSNDLALSNNFMQCAEGLLIESMQGAS